MSAGRPKQFLADLTLAMRSAAEAGRTAIVEQARESAESYIESLRQEAGERQAAIKEAAAQDVAQLRDQSKSQAQLVRDESERRIQVRRQALDGAVAEYTRAMAAEFEHVDARVAAWEKELEKFYVQLQDEMDPTIFASLAATMPPAPDFGEPDPSRLLQKRQSPKEQFVGAAQRVAAAAAAAAAAEASAEASAQSSPEAAPEPAAAEELPDHWWLDARYAAHSTAR